MLLVPEFSRAVYVALVVGAAAFGATLAPGEIWQFQASQDCFLRQHASLDAGAASGSMFVRAGDKVMVDGGQGARLSVNGLVVGHATITPMRKLMIGA